MTSRLITANDIVTSLFLSSIRVRRCFSMIGEYSVYFHLTVSGIIAHFLKKENVQFLQKCHNDFKPYM